MVMLFSSELFEELENQRHWAREEVLREWDDFEITERDGFFAASKAAETARLLAMTLGRVDQMEKRQAEAVHYLKFIASCLTVISVILAGTLAFIAG